MYDSNLVETGGEWGIGTNKSFVTLDKSRRFNVANNKILGKAPMPYFLDIG